MWVGKTFRLITKISYGHIVADRVNLKHRVRVYFSSENFVLYALIFMFEKTILHFGNNDGKKRLKWGTEKCSQE